MATRRRSGKLLAICRREPPLRRHIRTRLLLEWPTGLPPAQHRQLDEAVARVHALAPDPISSDLPVGRIELPPSDGETPCPRELEHLRERIDAAGSALSDELALTPSLYRAFDGRARVLLSRLQLWARALGELAHHDQPACPSRRVPPLEPIDTRVLELPRHQIWRHRELLDSMLGSIEFTLDAAARRAPAAADLVRRFQLWASLPPAITQPFDRDMSVRTPAQLERERDVEVGRQQDQQRQSDQMFRTRQTRRQTAAVVRASPVVPMPAVDIADTGVACLVTPLVAAWQSICSTFRG